tara:strand:- start:30 stop:281 length:252 start_codon:yes stop_codon:yes gene_type:complete
LQTFKTVCKVIIQPNKLNALKRLKISQMKTQISTPLEKITQLDFLDEDFYQISYYAYDKLKKRSCILTFPKISTSWNYTIDYK